MSSTKTVLISALLMTSLTSAGSITAQPSPTSSANAAAKRPVQACPAPRPISSSRGGSSLGGKSNRPKTARDIDPTLTSLSMSVSTYSRSISPSDLKNRDTTLKTVARRATLAAPKSIPTIDGNHDHTSPLSSASVRIRDSEQHDALTANAEGIDDSNLSEGSGPVSSVAGNGEPTAIGSAAYRFVSASGLAVLRMFNGTGRDGVAPPFPVATGLTHSPADAEHSEEDLESKIKIGTFANENGTMHDEQLRGLEKRKGRKPPATKPTATKPPRTGTTSTTRVFTGKSHPTTASTKTSSKGKWPNLFDQVRGQSTATTGQIHATAANHGPNPTQVGTVGSPPGHRPANLNSSDVNQPYQSNYHQVNSAPETHSDSKHANEASSQPQPIEHIDQSPHPPPTEKESQGTVQGTAAGQSPSEHVDTETYNVDQQTQSNEYQSQSQQYGQGDQDVSRQGETSQHTNTGYQSSHPVRALGEEDSGEELLEANGEDF